MAQSEQLPGQKGRRIAPEAELYELAKEEELRRLDGQRSELEGMRTRTSQYLAFVGAATAFLAGTGIKAPGRDGEFWLLASFASLLSLLAIFFAVSIFLALPLPRLQPMRWQFTLKAGAVLPMIESEVPGPNLAQLTRHLVTLYGHMSSENQTSLRTLRTVYVWFLVTGALQLLVWTVLVWAKA